MHACPHACFCIDPIPSGITFISFISPLTYNKFTPLRALVLTAVRYNCLCLSVSSRALPYFHVAVTRNPPRSEVEEELVLDSNQFGFHGRLALQTLVEHWLGDANEVIDISVPKKRRARQRANQAMAQERARGQQVIDMIHDMMKDVEAEEKAGVAATADRLQLCRNSYS